MLMKRASSSAKHQRRCASVFKGVRLRKWGKWAAEIRIPKSRKKIWLGSFDRIEQAAMAYDAALYCLRGLHPLSKFNFPDSPPNIVCGSDSPNDIIRISRNYALQNTRSGEKRFPEVDKGFDDFISRLSTLTWPEYEDVAFFSGYDNADDQEDAEEHECDSFQDLWGFEQQM